MFGTLRHQLTISVLFPSLSLFNLPPPPLAFSNRVDTATSDIHSEPRCTAQHAAVHIDLQSSVSAPYSFRIHFANLPLEVFAMKIQYISVMTYSSGEMIFSASTQL